MPPQNSSRFHEVEPRKLLKIWCLNLKMVLCYSVGQCFEMCLEELKEWRKKRRVLRQRFSDHSVANIATMQIIQIGILIILYNSGVWQAWQAAPAAPAAQAGDVLVRRKCLRSETENSWEKAQRCDPGKATGGAGPLTWYPKWLVCYRKSC